MPLLSRAVQELERFLPQALDRSSACCAPGVTPVRAVLCCAVCALVLCGVSDSLAALSSRAATSASDLSAVPALLTCVQGYDQSC